MIWKGGALTQSPGNVRDAVVNYLTALGRDASLQEITAAVSVQLGAVAASSVRSYLNLNVPAIFERPTRGRYMIALNQYNDNKNFDDFKCINIDRSILYNADCFEWLAQCDRNSIHAVVTDPPYGLIEYSEKEKSKLRNGVGGVWRIPPSFDGHVRSPLPRFTVLSKEDLREHRSFFHRLGVLLFRAVVPGANVLVASNPLLGHLVTSSLAETGFEPRGNICRLVMTMRGGDRPKNAHLDFPEVSVMPRSMFEPWVVLRKPLEGRVQDNLRKWQTGGFRRPSNDRPFGDVIKSHPTSAEERRLAPHPSLKPQSFMRKIVRASLPTGHGIILDPFAGSGSTLAAANSLSYDSIGIEHDKQYFDLASNSIAALSSLQLREIDPV